MTETVTTIAQVKAAVEHIRQISRDDEGAHGEEDDLHQAVLRSIANGTAEDPVTMADEALKTQDIEFARWCA